MENGPSMGLNAMESQLKAKYESKNGPISDVDFKQLRSWATEPKGPGVHKFWIVNGLLVEQGEQDNDTLEQIRKDNA